ncbi:MAG: LegC family aminotransferase [bacterium]|nr:LegC family aminotransferase [bacterium]
MSKALAGEVAELIAFVRQQYATEEFIPLHAPRFEGREKELVVDCIDSTFVSSVGKYVTQFEEEMARYVGAKHAVATVNGTQALFIALKLMGAAPGKLVLTQALSFAATCNAIWYTGAEPVFLDVDRDSMGLSPAALERYLSEEAEQVGDKWFDKAQGKEICAIVPMHTCGFPAKIDVLTFLAERHGIPLVEDAAESLGSFYAGQHTGTFGTLGIFSFNGNKVITTGGGGMIVTNDSELAAHAKHLTTTAKRPHAWEFFHDEMGYNFRLPNLNAALGVAQMEKLEEFVQNKRVLAGSYRHFFEGKHIRFVEEADQVRANYWLNAVVLGDLSEREAFLEATNQAGVMTRPLWTPLNRLPYNKNCYHDSLENTDWLFDRVVNLPSSVRG